MSVNNFLLETLNPGISYGLKGKRNQLRFFKSGDIINDVDLDFEMTWSHINNVYNGGIVKYYEDIKFNHSFF